MFQAEVVDKLKTHILCSTFFFRKSCRLWHNMEKYCKTGQATYDNMEHVQCMLCTWRYKHTLRICNSYCFSTATMVALTRLSVAIRVHSLYCYRSHERAQMTYMCLSKLLMVTFHIVSTVLRVRRLCILWEVLCVNLGQGQEGTIRPLFLMLC